MSTYLALLTPTFTPLDEGSEWIDPFRKLGNLPKLNKEDGDYVLGGGDVIFDTEDNNLITSVSKLHDSMHYPVLDLDLSCDLIPSSKINHSHLIINKPMTWDGYKKLLLVMKEVGILQPGYVDGSINKGFTAIRAPGHYKIGTKKSVKDLLYYNARLQTASKRNFSLYVHEAEVATNLMRENKALREKLRDLENFSLNNVIALEAVQKRILELEKICQDVQSVQNTYTETSVTTSAQKTDTFVPTATSFV